MTKTPKQALVLPQSARVDKPLSSAPRRRFYKTVALEELKDEAGFALLLDGRLVRTPGREKLVAPTRALAEGVAAEWKAQGETLQPETMPLTALLNTALDRVGPERASIIEALVGYGQTDLLCYRAETSGELAQRQAEQWQPVLEDLAHDEGIELLSTEGILPIPQHPEAVDRLRGLLDRPNVWELTAIQAITAALGSVVLALSVWRGSLGAEAAFQLAHLDDLYQEARWGRDAEAHERRTRLAADVSAMGRFLKLLEV